MLWSTTLFVDIHNHILPGIDDGARNLEESLEMARQAVAGGTDTLVATPHRAYGLRRQAPPDWVRPRVAELQAALDKEGIPLTVVPGVEIPVGPHVAADLVHGKLGTLGDGARALIEPPFDRLPPDALANLESVREAGFQVVLAHPERNAVIQQHLAFLDSCAALGIVFQLTTGSLLGRFGPLAQEAAQVILTHAHEWPLVLASDAHDLSVRSTGLMAAARDAAARFVGPDAAQAMVDSRPRAMLSGMPYSGAPTPSGSSH